MAPEEHPIRINPEDISQPTDDETIIASLPLLNALVVEPGDAWQFLATSFAPVPVGSVEVDSSGRIVIRDDQFAAAVKEALGEVSKGLNVGCGNWRCRC